LETPFDRQSEWQCITKAKGDSEVNPTIIVVVEINAGKIFPDLHIEPRTNQPVKSVNKIEFIVHSSRKILNGYVFVSVGLSGLSVHKRNAITTLPGIDRFWLQAIAFR